jgi:hypothetical protein
MSALSAIPVTVSQEAADHIAQLGMKAEFERMLEYARRNVPHLQRIDVSLEPPYDMGDEDRVILEVFQDPAHYGKCGSRWEWWGRWLTLTFHPDVFRHFTLLNTPGDGHGG